MFYFYYIQQIMFLSEIFCSFKNNSINSVFLFEIRFISNLELFAEGVLNIVCNIKNCIEWENVE